MSGHDATKTRMSLSFAHTQLAIHTDTMDWPNTTLSVQSVPPPFRANIAVLLVMHTDHSLFKPLEGIVMLQRT